MCICDLAIQRLRDCNDGAGDSSRSRAGVEQDTQSLREGSLSSYVLGENSLIMLIGNIHLYT